MTHWCSRCEYKTLYKSNLTKHERRVHGKMKDSHCVGTPTQPWACTCGKAFCHQSSLCRHMRSCGKTEKAQPTPASIPPAAGPQQVVTATMSASNHNTNCNNVNNITINITPYSKTNPELTHEKLVNLARGGMQEALLKMINEQHFNPEKPEGMNCYISNLKDRIGRIFEEDGWQVIEAKELSSGLFEKYKDCLDQVIDELTEVDREEIRSRANAGEKKYDKLLRFVKNWERKANLDEFVDGSSRVIHLLLYNKKDLVRKTHSLRR